MTITVDYISKAENEFAVGFSYPDQYQDLFNKSELRYEYDVNIEDVNESLLLVPFVGNIVPMAWLHGIDVNVPVLDATFHKSLSDIRQSMADLYSMVEFGDSNRVKPRTIEENTVANGEGNEGYAQLFTGGVDSLATYVQNEEKSPSVISIDADLWRQPEEYEVRKERISSFAREEGVNYHPVSTNMYYLMDHSSLEEEFEEGIYLSWWENFQLSLSYLTACVPLSTTEGYSKIFIASTSAEDYDYIHGSYPTTDNCISWNGTTCEQDSFDLTRHQKWRAIIEYFNKNGTDVLVKSCQQNESYNCNQCIQCIRNNIALSIENSDPEQYGHKIETGWFKRVEEDLKTGEIELKFYDILFWKDMQSYIPKDLHNADMGAEQKEFLDWFRDIDVFQYSSLDCSEFETWKVN